MNKMKNRMIHVTPVGRLALSVDLIQIDNILGENLT